LEKKAGTLKKVLNGTSIPWWGNFEEVVKGDFIKLNYIQNSKRLQTLLKQYGC